MTFESLKRGPHLNANLMLYNFFNCMEPKMLQLLKSNDINMLSNKDFTQFVEYAL